MGCDIHYFVERRSWPSDPGILAFIKGIAVGDPKDAVGPGAFADFLDERGESVAAAEARTLDALGVLKKLAPWVHLPEFDKATVRAKYRIDDGSYSQALYNEYIADPLYVGRDYALFGQLAGVRREDETWVAEPRGFPADASQEVFAQYTMKVVDDLGEGDDFPTGFCSVRNANAWLRAGSSEWVIPNEVITHPDWHTPSWLTVAELIAYRKRVKAQGKFWDKTLPLWAKAGPADDVRVVFWFDN